MIIVMFFNFSTYLCEIGILVTVLVLHKIRKTSAEFDLPKVSGFNMCVMVCPGA